MSDLGNKEVMAANIKKQLIKNGMAAIDVCMKLNIPKSTFSNWCNAKSYPRIDKIEMMAKTFGCTKADLVEKDSKEYMKSIVQTEEIPQYYYDEDSRRAAEFLHKNPMYKVLFDASRKVKPEDIDFVKQMIDRMTGDNVDDTGC